MKKRKSRIRRRRKMKKKRIRKRRRKRRRRRRKSKRGRRVREGVCSSVHPCALSPSPAARRFVSSAGSSSVQTLDKIQLQRTRGGEGLAASLPDGDSIKILKGGGGEHRTPSPPLPPSPH